MYMSFTRNILLIVILFCINSNSNSQRKLEFNAGISNNIFSFAPDLSSNQSGLGYNFNIGIDSIRLDWLKLKFDLGFEKYTGYISLIGGMVGGGHITYADIYNKSVIAFGIYPVNFKIFKKIDFNFGFDISALVYNNYKVIVKGWYPKGSYSNEITSGFNSKAYFGLKSSLAYNIKISDKYYISPQIKLYYGISNEFTSEDVHSLRQYFCVGVKKKI